MRYFPILDELFSSDSIIFMFIGLVIASIIGVKIKSTRKNLIGIIGSLIVYVICEVVSIIHTNFAIELLLIFVGTVAIGSFIGFLIDLIVSKIRK